MARDSHLGTPSPWQPRPTWLLMATLILAIGSTGGQSDSSASGRAVEGREAQSQDQAQRADVSISIDAAKFVRSVSPLVNGENIASWRPLLLGGELHPSDDVAALAVRLEARRVPILRFPGGSFSNVYDWRAPHEACFISGDGTWSDHASPCPPGRSLLLDAGNVLDSTEFGALSERASASSRMVTVNIDRAEPALQIRYVGTAPSARLTVTDSSLAVSAGPDSIALELTSAGHDTLGELAAAIDVLPAYEASPINLLSGGDMAADSNLDGVPDGWAVNPGAAPELIERSMQRPAHSPDPYSTRVRASGYGLGIWQYTENEWTAVRPGARYRLRAWLRVVSGQVLMLQYACDPTYQACVSGGQNFLLHSRTIGPTNGWQPFELTYTTSDETVWISTRFLTWAEGTTEFFADDVRLEKLSDSSPELRPVAGVDVRSAPHAVLREVGSPEAAAAWVEFFNVKHGPRVDYWELGNELYDEKQWSGSPEQYAEKVVAFATRMKAVDPTIKIGAVVADYTICWNQDNRYTRWNRTLFASEAARHIDFLVTHAYTYSQDGSEPNVLRLLAFPEQYRRCQETLWLNCRDPQCPDPDPVRWLQCEFQRLSPHARPDIEVHVTEWNLEPDSQWQHTLASGLFAGDMLGTLARTGVSSAQRWLAEGEQFGTHGGNAIEGWYDRPAALASRLFGQYFGSRLVEAKVSSPTYTVDQEQTNVQTGEYHYVSSYAATDDVASTLYVILINKHPSVSYTTEILLANFAAAAQPEVRQLAGPSMQSNNETGGHDTVRIEDVMGSLQGSSVHLELPAHSMTAVKLLNAFVPTPLPTARPSPLPTRTPLPVTSSRPDQWRFDGLILLGFGLWAVCRRTRGRGAVTR